MSKNILRTRNVTKKYGDALALDDVNIEIEKGQIYGLIGLNGAGKTTFMRAVLGLISLDRGEVELFGQTDKQELLRVRSRVGQSIETPAIYPHLTAKENLQVQRILGGTAEGGDIQETLEVVGLANTGNKKVKNFSYGMKQRLALAVALITNPQFLMLDEPANGLDPEGIIEMRELMRHLVREKGMTLLVSSHILDELARVATHYGVIHKGRIIKQLSARELALESQSFIKIVVSDVSRAMALLRGQCDIEDVRRMSANELRVYEATNRAGEMNTVLVRHGLTVECLSVLEETLEEYFMNLTTSKTKS